MIVRHDKHAQDVHKERERMFPLLCAWPTACADVSISAAILQVQPVLNDTFLLREKLLCSLPYDLLWQTSTHRAAQVMGLTPEGLSPRLRARLLAVTYEMSLFFESLI